MELAVYACYANSHARHARGRLLIAQHACRVTYFLATSVSSNALLAISVTPQPANATSAAPTVQVVLAAAATASVVQLDITFTPPP